MSMDGLCKQLGEYLGYGAALPQAAATAAMVNPDYGRRLIAARGAPALLAHLIEFPPPTGASASRFAFRERIAASAPENNSAQLLLDGGRSLLRWATTAFEPVDAATYERRLGACARCEHSREPPDKVVYAILQAVQPATKVCGLCGCVTVNKARIPHESCPAADPFDPAVTRWGEPRVSTSVLSTK